MMDFGQIATNPYFVMLVEEAISFLRRGKGESLSEFIEYLKQHDNAGLAEVIQNDNQLTNYLATMIKEKNDELMTILDNLTSMVATINARSEAFTPVASAMSVAPQLSDQAMSIIRQFVESGGHVLIPAHTIGQREYIISGGKGGVIVIEDERFLEDNLETLANYGLILPDLNSRGDTVYRIREAAMRFVESLPDKNTDKEV